MVVLPFEPVTAATGRRHAARAYRASSPERGQGVAHYEARDAERYRAPRRRARRRARRAPRRAPPLRTKSCPSNRSPRRATKSEAGGRDRLISPYRLHPHRERPSSDIRLGGSRKRAEIPRCHLTTFRAPPRPRPRDSAPSMRYLAASCPTASRARDPARQRRRQRPVERRPGEDQHERLVLLVTPLSARRCKLRGHQYQVSLISTPPLLRLPRQARPRSRPPRGRRGLAADRRTGASRRRSSDRSRAPCPRATRRRRGARATQRAESPPRDRARPSSHAGAAARRTRAAPPEALFNRRRDGARIFTARVVARQHGSSRRRAPPPRPSRGRFSGIAVTAAAEDAEETAARHLAHRCERLTSASGVWE